MGQDQVTHTFVLKIPEIGTLELWEVCVCVMCAFIFLALLHNDVPVLSLIPAPSTYSRFSFVTDVFFNYKLQHRDAVVGSSAWKMALETAVMGKGSPTNCTLPHKHTSQHFRQKTLGRKGAVVWDALALGLKYITRKHQNTEFLLDLFS